MKPGLLAYSFALKAGHLLQRVPPKETPLLGVIIGSFSIDNGNSSENATFRVNSRFSSSLKIDVYVLHKGYVTRDFLQRRF